jgi:hypothetical protein
MGNIISAMLDCCGYRPKTKKDEFNDAIQKIEHLGEEEYEKLLKYYQINKKNICCCY